MVSDESRRDPAVPLSFVTDHAHHCVVMCAGNDRYSAMSDVSRVVRPFRLVVVCLG